MNGAWVTFGATRNYLDADDAGTGGNIFDTNGWYSGVSRPRTPNSAGARSVAFWRLGTPDRMLENAGKVIRGFNCRVRVDGAVRPPVATLFFMPAVFGSKYSKLLPQAGEGSNWQHTFAEPVSSVPLGVMPLLDHFLDEVSPLRAPWWTGLQAGWVNSLATATLQGSPPSLNRNVATYPTVIDFNVFVSDRPQWWVLGQSAPVVDMGTSVPVKLKFAYPGPESDPVIGVKVRLGAGARTRVRVPGTTQWLAATVAETNAQGEVSFDVLGVASGTDALNIGLAAEQEGLAFAFDPYLPQTLPITVLAAPVPPTPGQCTVVPALPAVPSVPPRVEVNDDYGWNAGANSVVELDGDVEFGFTNQPRVVGAVLGLVGSRADVGSHDRMTHAFYFSQTAAGGRRFQVMERGQTMTAAAEYASSDQFRIQRVGSTIQYLRNGRLIYRSRAPSSGTVLVGCALYASSDSVPTSGGA